MVARLRLHLNFSHVKLITYDSVTIRLLGVEGAELTSLETAVVMSGRSVNLTLIPGQAS